MRSTTPLLFIGLSGYAYPHTRVRCYHFADQLRQLGLNTSVLSYRDHLGTQFQEADMYELSDRQKLWLNIKAFPKLFFRKKNIFYLQKIHYHSAASYLCYRLKNQPYIFDYDDYDIPLPCIFHNPNLNKFFFTTFDYKEMTEMIARNAVACVVSSHYLLDYLKKFNKNVLYIPTGVDLTRFQPLPDKPEKDNIILIWTGIVWGEPVFKNINFIFNCFRNLNKKYPNLELRILGGGRWMNKVEELTRAEYQNLPVRIFPWLEHEKMADFLNQADIGLMPLIEDTPWTRSKSPTKLFEYMAMHLPVVASPTGELSYILKDNETGYLAKTENEFTEKLEILIKNPELRNNIGLKARNRVEDEYSVQVLGKRLYDFLIQLPI